jgi:hypothetical protein
MEKMNKIEIECTCDGNYFAIIRNSQGNSLGITISYPTEALNAPDILSLLNL